MKKNPKRIYANGKYWWTEIWENSLKYTELEVVKAQAQ